MANTVGRRLNERFVLTEQAEADINEAWQYIAESNLDTADQIRDELYAAMQKLADILRMGRIWLELADKRHRFWSKSSAHLSTRAEN